MLRSRLSLTLAALTIGLAVPTAAGAAIVTQVDLTGVTKTHLHPIDNPCLLDDPTSCAPAVTPTPVPTPPPHGGGGGAQTPSDYCEAYKDALGDTANTRFGMDQLAALGCD